MKAPPRAASSGLSATSAPSFSSGSAFSRERFQTRTSMPAERKLRAIAAPMIPVPRTAIALSFAISLCVSLLEDASSDGCTTPLLINKHNH